MARPRTPIGTFGDITYVKTPQGQVRARTRFRDDDGQVRRVSATRSDRKSAERALKAVLAKRASHMASGELTADSTFPKLVEVWLEDLDLEGKIAPITREFYERNMRQLGGLLAQEQGLTPPFVGSEVLLCVAALSLATFWGWRCRRCELG